MKPFNLEQALSGKPVVRRDGVKIVQLVHMPTASTMYMRIIAVDENGYQKFYDESGTPVGSMESDRQLQLLMAPETVTVWMNIYKGDEAYGLRCCLFNETEAQALAHKMPKDFIKTISITIEI